MVILIKRTDRAERKAERVSRDIKSIGYAKSIHKDTRWYPNMNREVHHG